MKRLLKNWLALIAIIAVVSGGYRLVNSPGAHDVEAAQADDLKDAQAQAQQLASLVRKCFRLHGPTAELLQARGDYVCREGRIEPTPEAMLNRYALLGGGK